MAGLIRSIIASKNGLEWQGWSTALCTFFYQDSRTQQNFQDQVENCPIGQPFTKKWGFLPDLFGLGPEARLKLGEIRSILETLPMVQISSNLGKLIIFRFPTIEHNIRFQFYLVNFWLCLLTPGTLNIFWGQIFFALKSPEMKGNMILSKKNFAPKTVKTWFFFWTWPKNF